MAGGGRPARFNVLLLIGLMTTAGLLVAAARLTAETVSAQAQSAGVAPAQAVSYLRTHHFKVFLDVGHGGYDPGGTGPDGLPESFVNLEVAKRTAAILRAEGIAVELDRTANTFVSLGRRVELADASGANLFVGLYCNASSDPSVHGTTTYYYHSDSIKFARLLENRVASALGLANDGIVRDNLYVIKYTTTRMPDVLIEYAYISNRREERLLATPAFRERIAKSLAGAITEYFAGNELRRSTPRIARVTSVLSTNGTVQIHSVGRPNVNSYTFQDGSSVYFVISLSGAVLGNAARFLRVGPPFSGTVSVVQYTTKPDVVHVAVREDYLNTYGISVNRSDGTRFVTTIYPIAN